LHAIHRLDPREVGVALRETVDLLDEQRIAGVFLAVKLRSMAGALSPGRAEVHANKQRSA